ncbi:hypothetical protein [Sphingobium yanoikuyae]|uniref:hypothetical protein n=1 Tax=Sphingobium yanoikuyae TaxID=13690 RepID=UPI000262C433|nr:hypothetical protein [Sphingobium yanoikuyae]
MSELLPLTRALAPGTVPRPVRYGDTLQAILGGSSIDLHRIGDRWAIDVVTGRLKPEPDGRRWVAALIRSIGADVRMKWPQPGFDVRSPGPYVVDGGDQQGSVLQLRGGGPWGYAAQEGQFFNLIHNGRRYLKMVTQRALTGTDGALTVNFWPMLRIIPADGDMIDFADPQIEGVLTGQEAGWTLQRAQTAGLKFTITERE